MRLRLSSISSLSARSGRASGDAPPDESPANALTLNGQVLTLNGQTLTLGA